MKQYATERLIDIVWTLEYRMIDGKVEILSLNRENPIGYEKERELPRYALEEGEGRIVTGVYLAPYEPFKCWAGTDSKMFEVINPKYIFSYEKI